MVQIRPLHPDDAPVLAQQFNNKKIWNHIRDAIPYPYTLADAAYFIKISEEDSSLFNFAITYNKQFCGIVGLKAQNDIHRKSVELGYWIAEEFWQKGIATQAIGLITDWAFMHLNINRIFASVFENNIASMKALEHNAYRLEGILRKAVYKNQIFLDEYRYAKLKEI